jgi:hypothetical protein
MGSQSITASLQLSRAESRCLCDIFVKAHHRDHRDHGEEYFYSQYAVSGRQEAAE